MPFPPHALLISEAVNLSLRSKVALAANMAGAATIPIIPIIGVAISLELNRKSSFSVLPNIDLHKSLFLSLNSLDRLLLILCAIFALSLAQAPKINETENMKTLNKIIPIISYIKTYNYIIIYNLN